MSVTKGVYRVHYRMVIESTIEVIADSKEDAEERARRYSKVEVPTFINEIETEITAVETIGLLG